MPLSRFRQYVLPFIPLVYGSGVFFLFYWFAAEVSPFSFADAERLHGNTSVSTAVPRPDFAEYVVRAHFLVLLIVELGVVVFAGWMIYCTHRETPPYVSFLQFCLTTASFTLVALGLTRILGTLFGDIGLTLPITDALADVLSGECHPALADSKQYLVVAVGASFVPTVAILAAVCSLMPTVNWVSEESLWRYDKGYLRVELAQQMIRYKYYLYVAAVYLVGGVSFTWVIFWWLWSYLPEGLGAARDVKSVANGILVYQATYYVALLVVVFGPVACRLKWGAVRIAQLTLRMPSEVERRAWIADNGLTFTPSETTLNAVSFFSPALVPILSIAVDILF